MTEWFNEYKSEVEHNNEYKDYITDCIQCCGSNGTCLIKPLHFEK